MQGSTWFSPRVALAGLVLTAVPCAVQARIQFDAPFLTSPTGVSVRGTTIGDFNEDGRPDVVANARSGDFVIRLGDGTGQIHSASAGAHAPTTSSSIVSGDLNHDGHLDLVLAYGPAASVCVYLGAGDGTFGPRSDFPGPGESTSSVALEDFNEDGNLDVAATAVVGGGAGWVCVWTGLGDGGLAGRLDLFNDDIPVHVVAADVNDDGHEDLAYTDRYATGSLHIYPGHGDGTFGAVLWGAAGLYPIGLACGDLNQDGHADCVVANTDDFSIFVNLGHGDGTFAFSRYEVGGRPYSVTIGDFNGDGRPDLAVANYANHFAAIGNTVTILLNMNHGAFTRFADLPVYPQPQTIQTGDLNGDGRLDLVLTCYSTKALVTLLGNGDGTFGEPTFEVSPAPTAVAVGDLDGDGRPDVVTVNESNATLSMRLAQPARAFTPRVELPVPAYPTGVTTGDVNHDGFIDVVVASSGLVSFLPGDGAGHLGTRADFAVAGGTRSPQLADIDGDGNLDVITAHTTGNIITLLPGNGAGGFAPPVTLPAPSTTSAVRAADFDGDGRLDLASANDGAGSLSVFRNLGAGIFGPAVSYPSGSQPRDLCTGDFDKDGNLDIAVANRSGSSVAIFKGDGTGGFVRLADIPGLFSPTAVVALDANHDGQLDLAVLNAALSCASIHYGNGDGTFGARDYYGSGTSPTGVAVGDFDRDGEPDLVIPNYGSYDPYSTNNPPGTFAVLWNRGQEPVPVRLLSFNAIREASGAHVSWEVPESARRQLYHLYRSVPDGVRMSITASPLTGRTRYEVIDTTAPAGPVDYWLRETTPAGGATWLGPFGLLDTPAAPRLALWPNPARGPVTLMFSLPADAPVRITLFEAGGRHVARLLEQPLASGSHQLVWDRRTDEGRLVRPGVYFVKFETPTTVRSEKLLILN